MGTDNGEEGPTLDTRAYDAWDREKHPHSPPAVLVVRGDQGRRGEDAAASCVQRLLDGWSYDPRKRRWVAWSGRDSMNLRQYAERQATEAEVAVMAPYFGRNAHAD